MRTDDDGTGRYLRINTARQWELTRGREAIDWMHQSGVADRMLSEICAAVEQVIEWMVGESPERARAVLERYPDVLKRCDEIEFDDPIQALAYLLLHMPDRYVRTFQVLEKLVFLGALPIGKSDNFAAMDIGAGPGPGIHAIRSFYAALARFSSFDDSRHSMAPLRHLDIVERSRGMSLVMHLFSEALIGIECNGNELMMPWMEELQRSRLPFGATYDNFDDLDVKREYNETRERAISIRENNYREGSWYQEPPWRPSGYALIVMTNFLTTPDSVQRFSHGVDKLMLSSLVPGGVILVLGASNEKYKDIYRALDERARASGLTVLSGFEEPMQAGVRNSDLDAVQRTTRKAWTKLKGLAGDTSEIEEILRAARVSDIFDESAVFRLPRFSVRAYRRGRWPAKAAR